jgi:C4-type Zn-finger protein
MSKSKHVQCPKCNEWFERSFHPNDKNRDFPFNAKILGHIHICKNNPSKENSEE